MRVIKFNDPFFTNDLPDYALGIDYTTDRLYIADPATPTKKLTVYLETAPMRIDPFALLGGEGTFGTGSTYAAANRRDSTFDHNYVCGALDGDDDGPAIVADQRKTFDAVARTKHAALRAVFRDRNEKFLAPIQAAEESALREMRAEHAITTKTSKDSISLEAMRKLIEADATKLATFKKLAADEFIRAAVFPTPRPDADMDAEGNLLAKKDGKTIKARLGAQSRNVWAWRKEFAGKKKDQMPPGPSASELAPTPENATRVIEAMSSHYTYQPYKFFDVNGEIKPSTPMASPIKRSRDTLAIGTFSFHVYKTSANQVGVSLKPLGKLYIYRQVKSAKFSDAKDLGPRARPALADSDDEEPAGKRKRLVADDCDDDDAFAKRSRAYDDDDA